MSFAWHKAFLLAVLANLVAAAIVWALSRRLKRKG